MSNQENTNSPSDTKNEDLDEIQKINENNNSQIPPLESNNNNQEVVQAIKDENLQSDETNNNQKRYTIDDNKIDKDGNIIEPVLGSVIEFFCETIADFSDKLMEKKEIIKDPFEFMTDIWKERFLNYDLCSFYHTDCLSDVFGTPFTYFMDVIKDMYDWNCGYYKKLCHGCCSDDRKVPLPCFLLASIFFYTILFGVTIGITILSGFLLLMATIASLGGSFFIIIYDTICFSGYILIFGPLTLIAGIIYLLAILFFLIIRVITFILGILLLIAVFLLLIPFVFKYHIFIVSYYLVMFD